MIKPEIFYQELVENEIQFFAGVPDSLLKDICAYISDNTPLNRHVIAANEGAAVGLAVGNFLATGKVPLVYMQNSGFGNTVNPLLSIADDDVYGIPMLLLIGWRGEPGVKDEPQHLKQGKVSEELLQSMKIPYTILDNNSDSKKVLKEAVREAKSKNKPFAILVKKNSFDKYTLKSKSTSTLPLKREPAIKLIVQNLNNDDVVISTTGKTSRELFEYREELGQSHEKDFLTVGAMGHTSSIALGIAIEKSDRDIYCIDGDGSVLMHMGSLAINGLNKEIKNFKHIVINNGAHDSVGGQPTVGFQIDFPKVAEACGYSLVKTAKTEEEIIESLNIIKSHKGRAFLEIKVNKGARKDLGRPTKSPKENKKDFQAFLK